MKHSYDFVCHDCKKIYEIWMPIKELDDSHVCKSCGKELKRKFTPIRTIWKKPPGYYDMDKNMSESQAEDVMYELIKEEHDD
jgi:putative FmdB family regulatory protein